MSNTIEIYPKFQIGDTVWSKVGEFAKGIVIDWIYQRRTRSITYLVTFSPNDESKWYFDEEISEIQIFQ